VSWSYWLGVCSTLPYPRADTGRVVFFLRIWFRVCSTLPYLRAPLSRADTRQVRLPRLTVESGFIGVYHCSRKYCSGRGRSVDTGINGIGCRSWEVVQTLTGVLRSCSWRVFRITLSLDHATYVGLFLALAEEATFFFFFFFLFFLSLNFSSFFFLFFWDFFIFFYWIGFSLTWTSPPFFFFFFFS